MRLILLCLVLFCCGCGREAYDRRVAATRERLAYLDQENELLGEPLHFPAQPFALFLRPPKGIRTEPMEPTRRSSDWLRTYSNVDPDSLAPLQVLVGVHRKDVRRSELDGEILRALQMQAERVGPPPGGVSSKDFVLERASDWPSDRQSVKYRRYVLLGEDRIPVPRPERGPAPDRTLWRYDVATHDAGDWWVVVVFKQIDRAATAVRWRESSGFDVSWLRRLPSVDQELVEKQKTFALATLRVGARAEAATAAWEK